MTERRPASPTGANPGGPVMIALVGGPGAGKTTVLNHLRQHHSHQIQVYQEAARHVLTRHPRFQGRSAVQAQGFEFQAAIWQMQARQFARATRSRKAVAVFDRGLPDSLVYLQLKQIEPPAELQRLCRDRRYDAVFFLESPPFYVQDPQRQESEAEARRIQELLLGAYQECGYRPILVPYETVAQRSAAILAGVASLARR